jgi:hypothetical protein
VGSRGKRFPLLALNNLTYQWLALLWLLEGFGSTVILVMVMVVDREDEPSTTNLMADRHKSDHARGEGIRRFVGM